MSNVKLKKVKEIERICNLSYQGFIDSIKELLQVRTQVYLLAVEEQTWINHYNRSYNKAMNLLRTTSNFDSYQGEEYLTEDFESSYETSFEVLPQATPETSPTDLPKNKKRKTDEAHEKFCEVMGNLNSAVKVNMEGELTNNGFYKYIDSMLKTMDDKSRRLIEVEIINLVAERVNILYI
ncbi:uncharacterized protein isoform X3 [Musca autumnalis]|uniref:uncharacterized protein isoform X2 n=1 Tax=Musca autumnalis TaxID=221902 RepID=UPI003CEEBF88